MKTVLKALKVIVLTIVTFGLYGAYWIFINMFADDDVQDRDDSEQAARNAQDTITLTWLHFLNR